MSCACLGCQRTQYLRNYAAGRNPPPSERELQAVAARDCRLGVELLPDTPAPTSTSCQGTTPASSVLTLVDPPRTVDPLADATYDPELIRQALQPARDRAADAAAQAWVQALYGDRAIPPTPQRLPPPTTLTQDPTLPAWAQPTMAQLEDQQARWWLSEAYGDQVKQPPTPEPYTPDTGDPAIDRAVLRWLREAGYQS